MSTSLNVVLYRVEDGKLVNATLHTDLSQNDLITTEKEWGPIRRSAARRIHREGRLGEIPQHFHWDWGAKSQNLSLLAYQCFGIECDGDMQGMIMITNAGRNARLHPDVGKPLVYVDYLEAAPWNLDVMVSNPRYRGIGLILMRAAVQQSYDEGFFGRVGLHSLPQSIGFYEKGCMMQNCGSDPSYRDLSYLEMTRAAAAQYSGENGGAT